MELIFRSVRDFEEDLDLLGASERRIVVGKINDVCPGLACRKEEFCTLLTEPEEIRLKDGCCPSLSVLRVGETHAVILTVDEDPVYDQMVVTLLRVVPSGEAAQAYRSAAQALYRGRIETAGPDLKD